MTLEDSTHLDDALMAIADPTRRAILRTVALGEARVTELARPFRMSLAAVSKHIRILERAGLVLRRKAGREHFLSYNPSALDEAARWIEFQRKFWNTSLEALDDLLLLEDGAASINSNETGENL